MPSAAVVNLNETRWKVEIVDAAQHWEGQDDPKWCWAACLRMRAAIMGVDSLEQDELIARYKMQATRWFPDHTEAGAYIQRALQHIETTLQLNTDLATAAATTWEIEDALSPGHMDALAERSIFVVDYHDVLGPKISEEEMALSLAEGEPVIVTLTEGSEIDRHAYVLVSMTIENGRLIEVGMMDPLDERALARLPADAFEDRLRSAMTQRSVAATQQNELQWVAKANLAPGVHVRDPREQKLGSIAKLLGKDSSAPIESYYFDDALPEEIVSDGGQP
ncbi:MAG: hypothetical protein AAFX05_07815 [Planctomycetota bacterium]